MKQQHSIRYYNMHPGYTPADLTSWTCDVCGWGPFHPCVVAVGEIGEPGFRVITEPLHKYKARAIKNTLNLLYNQAVYYLLPYETFLKFRYGSAVNQKLEFEHPKSACKEE